MPRMDSTREEIDRRQEASLSPCALRSRLASRSRSLDHEGRLFDYRTEYQRDRDRILHSRAFRRLRLKSDGGAIGQADTRRDRLTHSLEAAQIARTIARAMALNEDLAEAIALGHALGCPPFGRDGAAALESIASLGPPPLPGGFDPGRQSLRILDLLEKRYEHPGLNLTHDVREGIFKLASARPEAAGEGSILDGVDSSKLRPGAAPSLEAQAVRAADAVAGAMGDLDDALRTGIIDPEEAEKLPIVRELIRHVGPRYPAGSRGRTFMKANVIHRGLTHLLVTATIHQARRALRAWRRSAGAESHEAFLASRDSLPHSLVEMGPRSLRLFEGLRAALDTRLRSSAEAAAASRRAAIVLHALAAAYRDDPRLLDDYVLIRFKEASGGPYLRDVPSGSRDAEVARRYRRSPLFLRLVVDHIAGMTDAYALSEHVRLSP